MPLPILPSTQDRLHELISLHRGIVGASTESFAEADRINAGLPGGAVRASRAVDFNHRASAGFNGIMVINLDENVREPS